MTELVATFGPGATAGVAKLSPTGPAVAKSHTNIVEILHGAMYWKGYGGSALSGAWN